MDGTSRNDCSGFNGLNQNQNATCSRIPIQSERGHGCGPARCFRPQKVRTAVQVAHRQPGPVSLRHHNDVCSLCMKLGGRLLVASVGGNLKFIRQRERQQTTILQCHNGHQKKASRCGATDVARRAGSAHGIKLQRGGISCRVSTCSIFYSVRCSEVQINETVGGRTAWAVSVSRSQSLTRLTSAARVVPLDSITSATSSLRQRRWWVVPLTSSTGR
jgi:hypothetical protein